VRTAAPIGEKPHNLADAPERWDGQWVYAGGALTAKIHDASNGVLSIAWIETEGPAFTCKTARVHVRDSGPWTYASLREDGDEKDGYLWARVRLSDRTLIAWMPDAGRFRQLVADGALPGATNRHEVTLGELAPRHYELLRNTSNPPPFVWDEPLIFIRSSE
jgi:hypothetical protein